MAKVHLLTQVTEKEMHSLSQVESNVPGSNSSLQVSEQEVVIS
jgi:hypothetical protein